MFGVKAGLFFANTQKYFDCVFGTKIRLKHSKCLCIGVLLKVQFQNSSL